jgi:hypothetical protein
MTYATTYHIGDNQLAPRVKTKGFASTVEQVRRLDAKNKGCKRNPQGQTATCTTTHVANGFLIYMGCFSELFHHFLGFFYSPALGQ